MTSSKKVVHARIRVTAVFSAVILLVLFIILQGCATSQSSTDRAKITLTEEGAVVEVELVEYAIHMPTSLPAGAVIFRIKNTGFFEHNIRFIGEGIDVALKNDLGGGESADLKVDLKPGEYYVTCPVGPHDSFGMHLDLTITVSGEQ